MNTARGNVTERDAAFSGLRGVVNEGALTAFSAFCPSAIFCTNFFKYARGNVLLGKGDAARRTRKARQRERDRAREGKIQRRQSVSGERESVKFAYFGTVTYIKKKKHEPPQKYAPPFARQCIFWPLRPSPAPSSLHYLWLLLVLPLSQHIRHWYSRAEPVNCYPHPAASSITSGA